MFHIRQLPRIDQNSPPEKNDNEKVVTNPAIEIQGLTKDYPVGFWRKRMCRSEAEIALKRLNEVSEVYWKTFGRFATSMQELRSVGLVEGDLKDPAGYPYAMGPHGIPQLDPHSSVKIESNQRKP